MAKIYIVTYASYTDQNNSWECMFIETAAFTSKKEATAKYQECKENAYAYAFNPEEYSADEPEYQYETCPTEEQEEKKKNKHIYQCVRDTSFMARVELSEHTL